MYYFTLFNTETLVFYRNLIAVSGEGLQVFSPEATADVSIGVEEIAGPQS